MIAGIFHQGSGLGNQLHRYIATRCIALDAGCEFGMANPELFKGSSFMNLDMGNLPGEMMNFAQEQKDVDENGVDVRGYDGELVRKIKDNTQIDGEFQDERYWQHHTKEVDEWLRVKPMDFPDDVCVIGFRGGEYTYCPDLFLPQSYWDEAIAEMRKINPMMEFRVVTDDPITAEKFFPTFRITHEIGMDWRAVRYAPYLIIANSSFYIFPAWLNENAKKIIAPKYWARRNLGFWALPQNEYKKFTYI
jgi:hypothetical protein